jgi:hypothetical protein
LTAATSSKSELFRAARFGDTHVLPLSCDAGCAAYLALEFLIVMWKKTFGDADALLKEHEEQAAL